MHARQTRLESSPVPSQEEFERLFAVVTNPNATLSEKSVAQNRLMSGNVRLLLSIARRFFNRGLERDEIISAGLHGLFDAVRRFDPAYGTRFSTYATTMIRETIRKAVLAKQNEKPFRLVTDQIIELDAGALPADEPGEALGEYVGDERYSPELAAMAKELLRLTRAALKELETIIRTLPERDALILRHRLGFRGVPILTLVELGCRYGVTKQAIHQSYAKALHVIRRRLRILPEGLTRLVAAEEELERIILSFSPDGNDSPNPPPRSAIQILIDAGYLTKAASKAGAVRHRRNRTRKRV